MDRVRASKRVRAAMFLIGAASFVGACGDSAGDRAGDQQGEEARPGVQQEGEADSAASARNVPPPPDTLKAIPQSEQARLITEEEVRTLMSRASELYWGLPELRTAERKTIGGTAMVALDRKKVKTLEDLRARYRPAYSEPMVEGIMHDFQAREEGGKVWVVEADGGDLSDYDKVKLVEVRPEGEDHLVALVSVPLGDGGDSEQRALRLERGSSGWKIAAMRTL